MSCLLPALPWPPPLGTRLSLRWLQWGSPWEDMSPCLSPLLHEPWERFQTCGCASAASAVSALERDLVGL